MQGDRFGGALDAAAKEFSEAYDAGMIPMEFVNTKRKKGELIMGIGHRVKSVKYLFNTYVSNQHFHMTILMYNSIQACLCELLPISL